MKIAKHLAFYSMLLCHIATYGQGFLTLPEKKNKIQNIKATLLPDGKSIYIQWESEYRDGEIIIARSNSMIDTPEKLYVADSLGRFPARLEKSISNFYDYNLKPGTYYYAVVNVQDVRNRKVQLVPDENFTTQPVYVEKPSPQETTKKVIPEKQTEGIKNVAAIQARAEGNNIRISWVPPWNAVPGKTIYSIYRSRSPLSTLLQMKEADKLAELPHPITNYLDQDIKESQTLYYGVSVKDEGMEEQLPLQEGRSFVRVFFVRDRFGKAEAIRDSQPPEITKEDEKMGDVPSNFIVRNLRYKWEGKGIVLEWEHPPNADETTQYTVYAGLKPFLGETSFIGNTVLKVATLNHPRNALYIKEIKKVDNLHFAVTAKKADIPEVYLMVQGTNTIPFVFPEESSSSTIASSNETQYPEPTQHTKTQEEKKPDQLPTPPAPESWTSQEESTKQEPKTPYLTTLEALPEPDHKSQPKEKEKDLAEDWELPSSDQLEKILRATYAKKNYHAAIYELKEYIRKEKKPERIGKASLFLGMSYYKTGDYEKALGMFLRKETENFDKGRTEFWKNQTLAKLGQPK